MDREIMILEALEGLAGAVKNLVSRVDAVEARAKDTASTQTTPGETTRRKAETPPPPPALIHPEFGTPIVQGTKRVHAELAVVIADAEGMDEAGVGYSRRLTVLFPGTTAYETVTGRSTSAGTSLTAEQALFEKSQWHFIGLVERLDGSFYVRTGKGSPARKITAYEARETIAASIARVAELPRIAKAAKLQSIEGLDPETTDIMKLFRTRYPRPAAPATEGKKKKA